MAGLGTDEIVKRLLSLAKPLLESAGIELIELKVGCHNHDVVIQITADKPQGGISIGECSKLNRAVVEAIDEAGFLPEDSYSLEFSSPGLDRPLTTYKDFLRHINHEVEFTLVEAIDGKKQVTGVVISVTEVLLTVFTKKKKELVIPLANVAQGMLVI